MGDAHHRKRARVPGTLISILALALSLGAQDPPPKAQQPVYRAASNTVLLDVVVTDRRNRVVGNLTKEDFAVYENDVPQEILSFQATRETLSQPAEKAAQEPRPAVGTRGPNREASASELNFIIFLIDYSTTEFENQRLVQAAAVDYVENRLGPKDLVAVFYLGAGFRFLQGFTADPELLASLLKGREVTGSGLASGSGVRPLTAAESSVVADAGAIAPSTGGPGGGAAALAAGQAAAANAQLFINARIQAALASMRTAIRSRTARGVLAAIEAISRAVAPMPQRKTMILFSQGFVVGPHMEPELNRAVDSANKANVAIYTIDSSGLNPGELSADLIPQDRLASITARRGRSRIPATGGESLFDRARTVGEDSQESSLRYVAQATGGLAFRNTNDLSLSLERVADDMRSHYVLSYQPSNQVFDGEFRKIRLDVKRPGLTVRTREGYWAIPTGVEGVSGEEYRLMTEVRAGERPTLPFDAALASFPDAGGLSRVPITIEIPAREVQFKEDGGKLVASIAMIGLLRGEDGRVAARVGAPVNVSATREEYRALQKGGLSFTNAVEVVPGRYSFEVLVHDQNSGKASIRDYSLNVPPTGAALTTSSIVLGSQVESAAGSSTDDFLAFDDVRLFPSARRQFRNGDNLVYLFNVYNVVATRDLAPSLEIRIMIERPGSETLKLPPYKVDQVRIEPIPHVSVRRYISLSGLVPGRYYLVAQIEDLRSQKVDQTRTHFEVIP